MQLVADRFETFTGAVLRPGAAPLSDEQFLELCQLYPDHRIESTAEGDLIIMPPAHPETGRRNAKITSRVEVWAESDGRGETFDSSTGYFLPNGARRSPDASWISKDRYAAARSREAAWHVVPEFVIELKSASDRISTLREKMREWMANGVELGWLLNPDNRTVEIYRADGSVEILRDPAEIVGEGPVAGLRVSTQRIW